MKANNFVSEIYDFLKLLSYNNDRKWFAENRGLYENAQKLFNELAELLLNEIALFDTSVDNLSLKDCTYRIYRDVRFSLDKSPYKTHMGVFVCPGGKKSCHSGYYLHIEPGKSILAVGSYMTCKSSLDSIREDVYSRSQEFLSTLKNKGDFQFDRSRSLIKLPHGFQKNHPMEEYLKQRDFCLFSPIPAKYLAGTIDQLVFYARNRFAALKEFNDFINRAIDAESE